MGDICLIRHRISRNGRIKCIDILLVRRIASGRIQVLALSILILIGDVFYSHACRLGCKPLSDFHFACEVSFSLFIGCIVKFVCQFMQRLAHDVLGGSRGSAG